MKISVLTLFPQMLEPLQASVIGKAIASGTLTLDAVDIRQYSTDRHHKCDDYPFGGGAGMLMTPQPVVDCIESVDPEHLAHRIYLSPRGRRLDDSLVRELAARDQLLLLCGHYEGVDQRAIDLTIDQEISIGDYVLTGGELAAMVLIDAVSRYVDGTLGSDLSTVEESFATGMLEYPQYTRPQVFRGMAVPEVLLSGHHAQIADWRRQQSIELTRQRRPDLFETEESNA